MQMEDTKTIFDQLIQTAVSEALLVDAIELYAENEIGDDTEREEFAEKYGDELYRPIIRKAVLDVVVAVVAAFKVSDDACYGGVVDMLELEEDDDAIRGMKRVMLQKLIDDALSDISDPAEEARFKNRMAYVARSLG